MWCLVPNSFGKIWLLNGELLKISIYQEPSDWDEALETMVNSMAECDLCKGEALSELEQVRPTCKLGV